MALKLGEFLIGLFGNGRIAVLFVSMFPLIELKGAIPIGTSEAFGLSLPETAIIAYIGSTIVCVAEFFLLIPLFNLLKKIKPVRTFVEKIEGVFIKKSADMTAKTGETTEKKARKMMMLSLFAFVAVPFPVTGVWTGTAIAVFTGLKFRESFLPVAAGNLVAGSIITLLTFLFRDYVDYIIYGLFAIVLVAFIIFVVKIIKSKPNEGGSDER